MNSKMLFKQNHESNNIYQEDLGSYPNNVVISLVEEKIFTIDMRESTVKGFGRVQSRERK